ncbi:MAG: NCS2 family permease [Lachnospiraceae bacterium]|nr:NCS2 family permease [Lachnospiraceae bacterium]
MEKLFRLKERGTDVRTEVTAGITTFMTMAYILAVNPLVLSETGMDFSKVFSATAISSLIATLVMGLLANLPFALSAGMGINVFFTYTVCLGMGYSWKWALTAIFIEGILFILMTFLNIRQAIVDSIPANLKKAISSGIGFFIAYIGLKNAGIIIADPQTVTALNPEWYKGQSGLAVLGLVITSVLLIRKVRGGLLLGIVLTTIIGIPLGITTYAGGSFVPTAPYFCEFAFSEIFSGSRALMDFLIIMLTFLFIDMFNTVGTLIGCVEKTNLLNEDGSIPNVKEALFADAIGTTAGAMLGTSTITTFVESATGVAEGARTGLSSVTVAALFGLSLFLAPLFGSIPGAATAPALIIVGVMLITPVTSINFSDLTEGIPAFLTIIFMICASSVSDGMMFGILSFILCKLFSGKKKEITPALKVVAVLFIIKIIVSAL